MTVCSPTQGLEKAIVAKVGAVLIPCCRVGLERLLVPILCRESQPPFPSQLQPYSESRPSSYGGHQLAGKLYLLLPSLDGGHQLAGTLYLLSPCLDSPSPLSDDFLVAHVVCSHN